MDLGIYVISYPKWKIDSEDIAKEINTIYDFLEGSKNLVLFFHKIDLIKDKNDLPSKKSVLKKLKNFKI